ncbi:hypothetical protein [Haloarchaeobius sp. HRN-SO-5]|uniref:hypothetical protein n=1 Tax=Haloarchaeobius sp. HRN-SO-5 TaxID=3446118 RepID=UPI003EB78A96
MPVDPDDPTVVRSLAIHADDVVAALEASNQGIEVVLRVTPPFNGRMRARIHRVQSVASDDGGMTDQPGDAPSVHVPPGSLVDDGVPPYPHADDTEPDDGEYDVEAHHDRHVAALERWRERVREHIVDSVELQTPDGPHRVDVSVLG